VRSEPDIFLGNEQLRQLDYALLYVIRNTDSGATLQLTNYDEGFTVVAGSEVVIPATWTNGVFTRAAIQHDSIQLTSDTTIKGVAVTISATDTMFQRLFFTIPTSRILIDIYRLNDVLNFTADGMIRIFSGELTSNSFAGLTYTGSFAPITFSIDKPIPRFFNQRRCNYVHYGPGCGLNKDNFSSHAVISSWLRYSRQLVVTITAISPNTGIAGGLYSNGYLIEPITGSKIGIVSGTDNGDGTSNLFVQYWIPELETVGSNLLVYRGCPHNVPGCNSFGNIANYGGEPFIPLKNPSYDGIT
jgi:hypothetical protein